MPYCLSDFGSYRVAGRIHSVHGHAPYSVQFTANTRYDYDPNGDFAVEGAYVQYYVPENRNDCCPVLLLHGGGMTGAMWETTPDERPGWLQRLLQAGFEVHVIDNVERGRAGWVPGLWEGEPFLRSMQEAWTLFRFGDRENFASRTPYANQQFPVRFLEDFARGFVPRWTSTAPAQIEALAAVIRRFDRINLICHSQGGEIAFRAAAREAERIAGLIAIEPSGFTDEPERLSGVPVTIVHGDYLQTADIWRSLRERWDAFVSAHRAAGGTADVLDLSLTVPGASHFPMMDASSDAYLASVLSHLRAKPE